VLLVAAALAPVISPHDPSAIQSKVKLTGLDSSHWFGTDNFGRDVFSRVLYGSRVSLYVGFGAVLIGGVIACSIGIFSGYVGGLIDTLIQRIVDAVMAFPTLVFLMGDRFRYWSWLKLGDHYSWCDIFRWSVTDYP